MIETQRLFLRPFQLSDALRVQKLAGDKAIADTTMNIPHPYQDGMAEEWIASHQARLESGGAVNFAIVLKSENELIGAIEIRVTKQFNRGELGYWVGKAFWSQGYCTEAAEAMLEYGFTELNLHKITAHHLTRNPASGKVMQKIAMQKEGVFREHVKRWEKYEDIACYGILNSEWESLINRAARA